MYRAKIDNSEFSLPSNSMCYRKIPAYHFCPVHKATITQNSPKCSELLLWQDAQSFDIWGIPPRLTVLFLTQKYQCNKKISAQKCQIDASMCIIL